MSVEKAEQGSQESGAPSLFSVGVTGDRRSDMASKCFVCPLEARFRCPLCEAVVFCSEEHGELHVREEEGKCQPFSVERGRVRASRQG